MPTNLDRIQTLLQPEAYAKVRTLAKHNRRALSSMSAELVEEALKLPKYRQQIEEAEIQVPVKEDSREFVPQPQLRKVVATSRAERDAKEEWANYYKGLKMLKEMEGKEEEELDDLIPVETDTSSEDTDERLKKMEEMIAQMAAMLATKA